MKRTALGGHSEYSCGEVKEGKEILRDNFRRWPFCSFDVTGKMPVLDEDRIANGEAVSVEERMLFVITPHPHLYRGTFGFACCRHVNLCLESIRIMSCCAVSCCVMSGHGVSCQVMSDHVRPIHQFAKSTCIFSSTDVKLKPSIDKKPLQLKPMSVAGAFLSSKAVAATNEMITQSIQVID